MTAHYFTQADAYALVGVKPTKMGPRARLSENINMDPDQVDYLLLALPPAATETHDFSALQNASLISVGQICDDEFQAILNK